MRTRTAEQARAQHAGCNWPCHPKPQGKGPPSPRLWRASFASPRRPPEISHPSFAARPPTLRCRALTGMDFAAIGPLVRPWRLSVGSCSSARSFAPRCFQTGPRGTRPCASLALCLTRPGQRTFTSKLSNMLGTPGPMEHAKNACPTGPWTAQRPRRPQRSTGIIVGSGTDETASKMTSQMEGAPGMR